MLMKIKFWHWNVIVIFNLFFLFFVLYLIPKKNFLNSYLIVKQITNWENTETNIQCQVILIWPKKLWQTSNNLKNILRIYNSDLNWELDLNKYQLVWLNSEKIIISGFDNSCLWTFRLVLIQLKSETFVHFFWKKLFNF